MARLLVVHDDRADVYVEVSSDDDGLWTARCTCGHVVEDRDPEAFRATVMVAVLHVDQTHRSL